VAEALMVQQGEAVAFVFCGREFLAAEIELIRSVASDFSSSESHRAIPYNL
jgi:hypothetical protein